MKRRSPKQWYTRAVAALQRRKGVDNPRAVAIALWKRMPAARQRAALIGKCTPLSGIDSAHIKAAIKATAEKVAHDGFDKARKAAKKYGTVLTLRPMKRVKAAAEKMARRAGVAVARKVIQAATKAARKLETQRNPGKGAGMSGKRRKRGHGGRYVKGGRGVKHVMVVGEPGARKHKKRGRRRYHGGMAGLPSMKGGMVKAGTNIAIGVVGAVAGALGMRYVPVADARAKAAIPLLLGIFLAVKMKNEMVKAAAGGLAIAGGLALTKALAPNLPVLAGLDDETTYLPAPDDAAADQVAAALEQQEEMEGTDAEDEDLMGEIVDLSGADRMGTEATTGPQTVADLLR